MIGTRTEVPATERVAVAAEVAALVALESVTKTRRSSPASRSPEPEVLNDTVTFAVEATALADAPNPAIASRALATTTPESSFAGRRR